jgi:hypothetical protein
VVLLLLGCLGRTPDTLPKARSQAGDHRLTSTTRGTTSPGRALLLGSAAHVAAAAAISCPTAPAPAAERALDEYALTDNDRDAAQCWATDAAAFAAGASVNLGCALSERSWLQAAGGLVAQAGRPHSDHLQALSHARRKVSLPDFNGPRKEVRHQMTPAQAAVTVEIVGDAEVRAGVKRALKSAGVSLEELAEQARASRFSSERARLAWFMISPVVSEHR